jgi:myo-inositol-1(or 4)-monophosphatase
MGPYARELAVAERAARDAAAAIMASYNSAGVRTKADGSFVTDADLASDRIIRTALAAAFPDDAILTEEGVDDRTRLGVDRCWIADPIDGTASFVERGDDFDVYLALAVREEPVVAVTIQPATGLLLTAVTGEGAWITRDGVRAPLRYESASDAVRIGTRPWLGSPGNLPILERVANAIGRGSRVIDAAFGLNVRSFLPPDHRVDAIVGTGANGAPLDAWEWDVAAVDLIVREAGGVSSDLRGNRLRFNQPSPRVADLLFATDPGAHARILEALNAELR